MDNVFWTAFGAVSTFLAFIAAAIAAVKLHKQTENVAETQQQIGVENINIALFQIRYNIYNRFSKIYDFNKLIRIKNEEIDIPGAKSIPKKVFISNLVMGEICGEQRKKITDEIEECRERISKSGDKKKTNRIELRMGKLVSDLMILDLESYKTILTTIKMSEFCFPHYISDELIKYTEELYGYISDISDVDEETVFKKLCDTIDFIEEENIIGKVKELLSITFEKTEDK